MSGTRARGYGQAAGLALLSLAAVVAFQPYLRGSSLRLIAGTLLVFFLPGYALQTILFPLNSDGGIAPRTRLAVSIGSSPALVALVALVVNELIGRITFGRLLTTLVLVTGGLLGVSLLQTLGTRRSAPQPTADGGWTPRRRVTDHLPRPALSAVLGGKSRRQWALVGVAAILFVGLLAAPAPQQAYTELSLLTETEQGQLTADDYPKTLAPGASTPVVVTVRNEEQIAQDYTLIITREQAGGEGEILATKRVDLADGETRRLRTALVAPETLGKVRFIYRLYRTETVESADSVENLPSPYRETRLLITVRPSPEGDA